jgi:hypothetical protein
VIRICYENFATGTHDVTALHGKAVRGKRGVTLYLLPGLTTGQRRRAIRRLRQEASRGFGPSLPSLPLAIALGRDRLSMAVKTTGAAVRLHPAVTLLPGGFLVILMTLFIMAASGGTSGALLARPGFAGAPVGTRTASSARLPALTGLGGTGLGAGRPAPTSRPLPRRMVRKAAWYTACPEPTSSSAPDSACGGQLASQRATRGDAPVTTGPPTAHLPGPRDLAR